MPGVESRLAFGCAAALLLAFTLAATAARAQEPARLIDGILGDGTYQTELPGRETVVEPMLQQADPDPPPVRPPTADTIPEPIPEGGNALAEGLLWTLLIAAGVVLLIYLALLVLGRRRPLAAAPEAEPDARRATSRGSARSGPLGDADALAEDRNWAEAIHMLLLDGLDKLRRRAGHSVPPALTSRELLRRIALPERQASAFAALVAAVERCHFGGRPAGYEEYQACRAHYRAFTDQSGPAGGAA